MDTVLAVLANPWVQKALGTVIIAAATSIVARLAARALRRILQRDRNPLPNASIIVNITRAVIWIIGGSILLDACYGINASALIAALGVGGIAVSLGFQDTLANLIGGLQVTFMGIVAPGDNIEVGAAHGIVQDVSWRHTTIKDASGQLVIIPNSIISKTALVHLLPAGRVVVPFAVSAEMLAARREEAAHDTAPALEPESSTLDALARELIERAQAAAVSICVLDTDPRVSFSEVTARGITGSIILTVADDAQTSAVTDAVVRAIADLLS